MDGGEKVIVDLEPRVFFRPAVRTADIGEQIEIVLVTKEIARLQYPVAGDENGHLAEGFHHGIHPRSVLLL